MLEPADAQTHYNLALALKYKGDSRQAAQEFQAAIALNPNWADAHFGLGAASYDLHDQLAALKELRAALAPDQTTPGRTATWPAFVWSRTIPPLPPMNCGWQSRRSHQPSCISSSDWPRDSSAICPPLPRNSVPPSS